jgi:hypothetical protein
MTGAALVTYPAAVVVVAVVLVMLDTVTTCSHG